jgi:hypothetical protein
LEYNCIPILLSYIDPFQSLAKWAVSYHAYIVQVTGTSHHPSDDLIDHRD